MSSVKSLRLSIRSELGNVPLIGISVNKLCKLIPITDVEAYQSELCVVEAVTNCIKHAYKHEPNHWIHVDYELYIDRVVFKVHDTGNSMPGLEEPTLEYDPTNLDEIPEGGMGLFIINDVMDTISYQTENGENTLEFSKVFAPAAVSS